MKFQYKMKLQKKQAGASLMEAISYLAIASVVIVGAVSLLGNANSANSSNELLRDLHAVRSATQSFFQGQGTYGTASLNSTLITAKKIPATLSVSGSTISTSVGGTLVVTGNTSNFTMALSNLPADVCSSLIANSSTGWAQVQVGSSPAITTFPVSPTTATAAANCGGTAPFTVTWTTTS